MNNPQLNYFDIPISEFDKKPRKIAYWEWGNPNNLKVLFCVHGLTRNGRDFDYLARALQDNYRIICPDVAGRGQSDWIEDKSAYHNFTYARDMLGLISSLRIRELHWVGTSMGGLIAMVITSIMPNLIKKLVINDIGPFLPKSALKRIAEYTGSNPIFKNLDDVRKYFEVIYSPWSLKSEEHWEHIMNHSIKPKGDGTFIFSYDPGIGNNFRDEKGNIKEMEDVNLWEIWKKINCPVLCLRGELSDLLRPDTTQDMMITGPKAKIVEFKGVGHAPSLMDEEQIKIVKDWILKIEA